MTLRMLSERCQRSRARDPQHVARALVVEIAARDEQEIRQPVDVARTSAETLLAGVLQLDDHPLGAAADRAREMQIGRGGRAAGEHEGAQRRKLGIERVDLVLQPLHLLGVDGEPLAARPLALVGRAEIGGEIEQVVLDARQHGVDRGRIRGVQPRDADRGGDLVHGAVGVDAQVILLAMLAIAEHRHAFIARARIDAIEHHHVQTSSPFRLFEFPAIVYPIRAVPGTKRR